MLSSALDAGKCGRQTVTINSAVEYLRGYLNKQELYIQGPLVTHAMQEMKHGEIEACRELMGVLVAGCDIESHINKQLVAARSKLARHSVACKLRTQGRINVYKMVQGML